MVCHYASRAEPKANQISHTRTRFVSYIDVAIDNDATVYFLVLIPNRILWLRLVDHCRLTIPAFYLSHIFSIKRMVCLVLFMLSTVFSGRR